MSDDIIKKIDNFLSENMTRSERRQIDNFIKYLKKNNIKSFSSKNINKILDDYGEIDTDFLMDNWEEMKTKMKKNDIKVESKDEDSDNFIEEKFNYGLIIPEIQKLTVEPKNNKKELKEVCEALIKIVSSDEPVSNAFTRRLSKVLPGVSKDVLSNFMGGKYQK